MSSGTDNNSTIDMNTSFWLGETKTTTGVTKHRSDVFLSQGVAICDIDNEAGQQRLQELKEEYGQGRVIFIQVDVRSYQQFEGDRNLLWRAENVTINIIIMSI